MADRLRDLAEYAQAYMAKATRGRTLRLAREWMEADVDVDTAATWASLNFHPTEARPYIEMGVTPEGAAELEDARLGEGSPEVKAMRWVDQFREDPRLVVPPEA